jgi:hypothetical protein
VINISSKSKNFYYLLLSIFILILYGDSILYGYISDDFVLINYSFYDVINESIHGLYFRPIWYLSYTLSNFFTHSPIIDHIINIILFILCSILLFNYTLKFLNKIQSLLVITLWISLPWMVFPVVWISQRNDLLMIIFALLSIIYFKKNTFFSIVFLIFSFLSKTNSFLLPIYFLIISIYELKYRRIVLYIFIQVLFILISLRSLMKSDNTLHLNIIESILNKVSHLIISLSTQFIPIQFFINFINFFFYLIIIVLLFISVKLKNKINLTGNREIFILFIIFWLPSAISSELRIVILCSYFLLLLIFKSLVIKRIRYFYTFILLFFINNIISITLCKNNFNSKNFNNRNYYYNNNFYLEKRKMLLKLLNNYKNNFFE